MALRPKKIWKKGRLLGVTPSPIGVGPALVFSDVDEDGQPRGDVKLVVSPEPGKPIPLGASLADFRGKDGEDDFEYNVTATVGRATSSGPVQVSTAGYRDGWEKTFGSKGVN